MKKILVVLVVLAVTVMSSMAFAAAELTFGGNIDSRSRAFHNLDNTDNTADYDRSTETRVRVGMDAKAGDAKGRVALEWDWEKWGTVDNIANSKNGQAGAASIRESWLDTPLFGGVRLKGGHMFLQLSNGWFLRNMKNGDDAWVGYTDMGNLHLGLVDAKIAEAAKDGDLDFYAAVATMKMSDDMSVGANLSRVIFAKPSAAAGSNVLNNLGVHASLGLGALKLQAEADYQMGTNKTAAACVGGACPDYAGYQVVAQGTMAMDPVSINFTAAVGSGNEAIAPLVGVNDIDQIQTVLDFDPHYTFIYEYLMKTAAGATHTGFANTTALGAGADVKLGSLTVGGNAWLLLATEDRALNGAVDALGNPILADDLGLEIDARIGWKISDNVAWNVTLGYFMPGDAYMVNDPITGIGADADETTAIQGVLSFKF